MMRKIFNKVGGVHLRAIILVPGMLAGCAQPYKPDLAHGPVANLRMQSYMRTATAYAFPEACFSSTPQIIADLVDKTTSGGFVDIKIPAEVPIGLGFSGTVNTGPFSENSCQMYVKFTPEAGENYVVTYARSVIIKNTCEVRVYKARRTTDGVYWREPVPTAQQLPRCGTGS